MTDDTGVIKRIPYGISDYGRIRRENHYYVDKTIYLDKIIKSGSYLFFIRPRRFGKSLFLSLMEAYFDVYYNSRFDELFSGTWIHDHATAEKGKYLVLSFNFSAVNPAPGKMEASFLEHVRGNALDFISKYEKYLDSDRNSFIETINHTLSASDILSSLFRLCKRSHREVFVIIDEYDNFSNTILAATGKDAYNSLTHGPGFFPSFFNVLKSGTSGMDAPVSRSFITGVSPITMDDVTSGYNIGKNISLEPELHNMLGFTTDDVVKLLEYYKQKGKIKHSVSFLMEIMTRWYGNYLFCDMEEEKGIFNADMVLYFIDKYLTQKQLPQNLIDRNVRVDYGKLRHLILLDSDQGKSRTNGNFSLLKEVIEKGETASQLKDGFPLEQLADRENFISLLFYFGLLTIKGRQLNQQVLAVPNETIRHLYYDYIKEAYVETDVFALDIYTYNRLMTKMALNGEWKPLLDYIVAGMRESMSLRDLITGEKAVQAFLNVYLGLSNLYVIHAEKELNKGYADIVMEPFLARFAEIKYSYLIEIKYLKGGLKSKSGESDGKKLREVIEKGEEQLKRYSLDKKLSKSLGKTKLIKLLMVFSGHEAVYLGEVL